MDKRAKFINTNEEQNYRIEKIRNLFSNMYKAIDKNCKKGREKALVYTKLEEAQFWAIKGISREGDK